MTPWLTSQCPYCGVIAVLRRLDNVMLHDCNCNGPSNPWKDIPEGTLVIWKEKPHKKEWEKLFNLYQMGAIGKEAIQNAFELDFCPDGCLMVRKEALL